MRIQLELFRSSMSAIIYSAKLCKFSYNNYLGNYSQAMGSLLREFNKTHKLNSKNSQNKFFRNAHKEFKEPAFTTTLQNKLPRIFTKFARSIFDGVLSSKVTGFRSPTFLIETLSLVSF